MGTGEGRMHPHGGGPAPRGIRCGWVWVWVCANGNRRGGMTGQAFRPGAGTDRGPACNNEAPRTRVKCCIVRRQWGWLLAGKERGTATRTAHSEGCAYTHVYACTCPCARVNAVSGPFFREGGQMLSLCVYNIPTVSTISRPPPLVVHSVYRLCKVSPNYAQCPQTIRIRIYVTYLSRVHIRVYMYTPIRE